MSVLKTNVKAAATGPVTPVAATVGVAVASGQSSNPVAAFCFGDNTASWSGIRVGQIGGGTGFIQPAGFVANAADSETPLGALGVYTSSALSLASVPQWIVGYVAADQAGVLSLSQQRSGGTSRTTISEAIAAGNSRQFGSTANQLRSDGWRIMIAGTDNVVYTNGAIAQGSFSLQANLFRVG